VAGLKPQDSSRRNSTACPLGVFALGVTRLFLCASLDSAGNPSVSSKSPSGSFFSYRVLKKSFFIFRLKLENAGSPDV